jgi:two-component system, LuxR family, response regulator FixJ
MAWNNTGPDAANRTEGGAMIAQRTSVRVIDDDPEMRKSLKWLLETASLEVETFASFQEFREQTDHDTPGCLILDLRLADEDGVNVMQRLASLPDLHLPVIILTGNGEVESAVQCMKLGALDFFQKPAKSEALIAKVCEAIAIDQCRRRELYSIDAARRQIQSLSPREQQMVVMISQGLSSKQIAVKLGISVKTVVNRRARAMAKAGARNSPELVGLFATARLSEDVLCK